MTPTKQISLRTVIATLEKRLGAPPLKHYWREEPGQFGNEPNTLGCELTYQGLKPQQVQKAMEGIPKIEGRSFKHRAYKYLLRWEHVSPQLKFRCTLYIYEGGQQHFIFTTTW